MFDSDQEFFDCPFCGTKFDAIDFHQDEIVSQAEESLKEEAYSSAKEKYYSLLEKDPSDFEALKGLILCELKTPSLDSLKRYYRFIFSGGMMQSPPVRWLSL